VAVHSYNVSQYQVQHGSTDMDAWSLLVPMFSFTRVEHTSFVLGHEAAHARERISSPADMRDM
jgi:hypothetical protein